jgi:hypothetical protein
MRWTNSLICAVFTTMGFFAACQPATTEIPHQVLTPSPLPLYSESPSRSEWKIVIQQPTGIEPEDKVQFQSVAHPSPPLSVPSATAIPVVSDGQPTIYVTKIGEERWRVEARTIITEVEALKSLAAIPDLNLDSNWEAVYQYTEHTRFGLWSAYLFIRPEAAKKMILMPATNSRPP